MTTSDSIQFVIDKKGIARITLCRTQYHNALDDKMIASITDVLQECHQNKTLRALVLQAEGDNFSAGADLRWMKRAAHHSFEDNKNDANALSQMIALLFHLPIPTIAKVHGQTYGGANGLICACDIAVAADTSTFCFSEVKLGLIPAVISPYVVAVIGQRQAERYFLTAEAFDAVTAVRMGMIHEVCAASTLNDLCNRLIDRVLQNGPIAVREAKALIRTVHNKPIDDIAPYTVEKIASLRVSTEGQEGLQAFLENRAPNWCPNIDN